MKKIRHLGVYLSVALMIMIVGGIVIVFTSCEEDPYASASISVSRTSVPITMDVDSMLASNTKIQTNVSVTVSGMPSGISRQIFVTSENTNVATATVGRPDGNTSVITITAINGGSTRIRVLSSGGSKVTYIDVNVIVPAKQLELKTDTSFAVMKKISETSELEFSQADFNFYASSTKNTDFRYTTTVNDLEFRFKNGKPIGVDIADNKLIVEPTAIAGSVDIIATLVNSTIEPKPTLEFTAWIFEPFGDAELHYDVAKTVVADDTCELVQNENSSIKGFYTWRDYNVTMKNALNNNILSLGDDYAYYIANRYEQYVLVNYQSFTQGQSNFQLVANGVGEGWVDIVFYPIARDSSGNVITRFNQAQHAHVQKTKRIYVEVRNVFQNTNKLRVNNNDIDELTVFYAPGKMSEQTPFFFKLTEDMLVHNPPAPSSHRLNANVSFHLRIDGVPDDRTLTDLFWFYYNGRPVSTLDPNVGLLYSGDFAIMLRDPSLLGVADIQLDVKSVAQPTITLCTIDLTCLSSVDKVSIYDQHNDEETAWLYPLRDTSATPSNDEYIFYIDLDAYDPTNSGVTLSDSEKTNSKSFIFTFDNPLHQDLFTFECLGIDPETGRIKFSVSVATHKSGINAGKQVDVPSGEEFSLKIAYANGTYAPMTISLLDKLSRIDNMQTRVVESGHIYPDGYKWQTGDVAILTRAFVRIGGTYSFDTVAYPNYDIWAVITDATGAEDFGRTFKFDTEGKHELYVKFQALNDSSLIPLGLGGGAPQKIDVYVVNPLVNAGFENNYINDIIARNTMYTLNAMDNPEKTLRSIALDFQYYNNSGSGVYSEWPVDVQIPSNIIGDNGSTFIRILQTANDLIAIQNEDEYKYQIQGTMSTGAKFTIQGLLSTDGNFINIQFTIQQVISIDVGGGVYDEVVIFAPRVVSLYVKVNSSTLVQDINVYSSGKTPVGDILNLEAVSGGDNPYALDIEVSPNNVTDKRVGYALEIDGVYTPILRCDNPRQNCSCYLHVDADTNTLYPRNANITINQSVSVVLVIYSYDSVREGAIPFTYTRIAINIYDSGAVKFINTRKDFLAEFYIAVDENAGIYKGKTFSGRSTDGFYRLANDIDLGGLTLYPIVNFGGTITGTNYNIRHTISGFKITNETAYIESDGSFNYGMFHNLSGTVEDINFADVFINFSGTRKGINSLGTVLTAASNPNINVGVVASSIRHYVYTDYLKYRGTIRDVTVSINSTSNYNFKSFERLNFGVIAGVNNEGLIEEQNRLYTTGLMTFTMPTSGLDYESQSATIGNVYSFNIGGLVGLNMVGGALNGPSGTPITQSPTNITRTSDIVIAVVGNSNNDSHASILGINRNVGGLAGRNAGTIYNLSCENVIYNSTRGNTGGLVGYNESGVSTGTNNGIANCYSNGAIMARGSFGGLVGHNTTSGKISASYYDFIINTKVTEGFGKLSKYISINYYAGFIIPPNANNNGTATSAYPTFVGGIAGYSVGDILSCYATSAFASRDVSDIVKTVNNVAYKGDIYIDNSYEHSNYMGIYPSNIGGIAGNSGGVISGCFVELTLGYTFGTTATTIQKIGPNSSGTQWYDSNITKPEQTGFALRSTDCPVETPDCGECLRCINGLKWNDLGGINYAITTTSHTHRDTGGNIVDCDCPVQGVALLYTSGTNKKTGNYEAANKYYLEDIFKDPQIGLVSPTSASNRITLILDNNTGAATLGVDTKRGGIAKYYIEVTQEGSFELYARSVRSDSGSDEDVTTHRIRFDVFKGITQQSVSTNTGFGQVAYKSLLSGHSGNSRYDFAVPKESQYWLKGSVDGSNWQVKGERRNNGQGEFSSYQNGKQVPFDEMLGISSIEFKFTPYIERYYYHYEFSALGASVTMHFLKTATKLTLEQDEIATDPSSAAVFSGELLTDVSLSTGIPAAGNPLSDANAEALRDAERVRDLIAFTYETGGTVHRLFASDSRAPDPNRYVIEGDRWDTIFTLKATSTHYTQDASIPVGYTLYKYQIFVTVDVGAYIYDIDANGNISGIDRPMEHGFKGVVTVTEREKAQNFSVEQGVTIFYNYERLTASSNLDVFAQELQAVNFQHYSKTGEVELTNGKKGFIADLDAQFQNNNVYMDSAVDGVGGGLLRVSTSPIFACVGQIWMESSIYTAEDGVDFDIVFVQLVLDLDETKIQGKPVFDEKSWVELNSGLPVSTQWKEGNVTKYGWDGTYYFYTILNAHNKSGNIEVHAQFDIKTTLNVLDLEATLARADRYPQYNNISNETHRNVVSDLKLRVAERPGLFFNYDGHGSAGIQAVGTSVAFNTYINGKGVDYVYQEGGVPKFDVVMDSANINNYDWLVYDGNGEWRLTIDHVDYKNLIGKTIRIVMYYSVEEFGNVFSNLPVELNIDIALFKIKTEGGFYIDGVRGNNIRLSNNTMQSMRIRVDAERYNKDDNQELVAAINTAILDLETAINNDQNELLVWTGVVGGTGYSLNHIWNAEMGYYQDSAYDTDNNRLLNFMLGKRDNTKFIVSTFINDVSHNLNIQMGYEYDKDGFAVIKQVHASPKYTFSASFTITTFLRSDESNPILIRTDSTSTALEKFKNMQAGEHYILMEDLDIGGWKPMTFNALSFDGNNKKIKINGFDLSDYPREIGLFSTIAAGSVIKNVNIVLPSSLSQSSVDIDLTQYSTSALSGSTFSIGALAGINNGIVTNCAVLPEVQFEKGAVANYSISFTDKEKNSSRSRIAVFSEDSSVTLNIGGLVGINSANSVISNSRVLIDVYASNLYADDRTGDGSTQPSNVRRIVIAGFAAVNRGTIVASFFRDASVTNNCKDIGEVVGSSVVSGNLTAGFVGYNIGGLIKSCYAMGFTTDLNPIDGSVSGGVIFSLRANVAGFVYTNENDSTASAVIEDCYVSVITSGGILRSGFIHSNSATVRNCYVNNPSVNSSVTGSQYHAFSITYNYSGTGGNGNYTNNKYRNHFNTSPTNTTLDWAAIQNTESGITNITNVKFFNGFSITDLENGVENADAVTIWKMTAVGPRIVAASDNNIATSIRELQGFDIRGEAILVYLSSYEGLTEIGYGQKRNPVLITSGSQFDNEIYEQSGAKMQYNNYVATDGAIKIKYEENVYQKHMRLVNNISLASAGLNDSELQTYQAIYADGVLDGNGLSITNISVNAAAAQSRGEVGSLDSIGLFSKIENATIKSLKLSFVPYNNQYAVNSSSATYTGGLAGQVTNSIVIDIQIQSGSNGTVRGRSITGGLIGKVENSLIESISGSVAVESFLGQNQEIREQFHNAEQYLAQDISVAGGLIGYADNGTVIKNIKNRDGANFTVSAEVAGGLIGVVTSGAYAEQLQTSSGSSLTGKYYLGGLVGINLGEIHSSTSAGGLGILPHASRYIVEAPNYMTGMIVGGITGYNSGLLDTVTSTVTIDKNNGADSIWILGGVAGMNREIKDAQSGTVIGGIIRNSRVGVTSGSQTLSGGFYVGGIVGYNNGSISNITGCARNANLSISASAINTIFGEEIPGTDEYYFNGYRITNPVNAAKYTGDAIGYNYNADDEESHGRSYKFYTVGNSTLVAI